MCIVVKFLIRVVLFWVLYDCNIILYYVSYVLFVEYREKFFFLNRVFCLVC